MAVRALPERDRCQPQQLARMAFDHERIQAVPSVTTAPNERWSTDIARIWAGRAGWAPLALHPFRGNSNGCGWIGRQIEKDAEKCSHQTLRNSADKVLSV